jgi:hypothetical protein
MLDDSEPAVLVVAPELEQLAAALAEFIVAVKNHVDAMDPERPERSQDSAQVII